MPAKEITLFVSMLLCAHALGDLVPIEWSPRVISSHCKEYGDPKLTSALTLMSEILSNNSPSSSLPKSCLEIKNSSPDSPSGYYMLLNATSGARSFTYCDMDDLLFCASSLLSVLEQLQVANIKGEKGDTGMTGPAGKKGEVGLIGAPGISGIPGKPGQKGQKGSKGETGFTPSGPTGVPGVPIRKREIGPKGAVGSNESLGMKGSMKKRDIGIIGHTEATGMTGSNGDKGTIDKGTITMATHTGVTEMSGCKEDIEMTGPNGSKGAIGLTNSNRHEGDTETVGPTGPNRQV